MQFAAPKFIFVDALNVPTYNLFHHEVTGAHALSVVKEVVDLITTTPGPPAPEVCTRPRSTTTTTTATT